MNFSGNKNAEKNPLTTADFPAQLPLFAVQGKKTELNFNHPDISIDGGALLLQEMENRTGIIASLCQAIDDTRDQRYISHTLYELLCQRTLQIACGYEDANDAGDLKADPVLKMCAGRLPETGDDLGSQPTISRLENAISQTDLYRIAQAIVLHFIQSYDK